MVEEGEGVVAEEGDYEVVVQGCEVERVAEKEGQPDTTSLEGVQIRREDGGRLTNDS